MSAITVTKVSKSYKGVKALSDVSFSVNEGELLGLIGLTVPARALCSVFSVRCSCPIAVLPMSLGLTW